MIKIDICFEFIANYVCFLILQKYEKFSKKTNLIIYLLFKLHLLPLTIYKYICYNNEYFIVDMTDYNLIVKLHKLVESVCQTKEELLPVAMSLM